MAIIKHISMKNSNYGGAEKYLKYEHDEKTLKPLRDDNGHLIERQNYKISGINCNVETFGIECVETNLKYKQNMKAGDIKAHHYIISFEKEDKQKGLDVEKAHQLGTDFCKKNFPGHQALVATHNDGHNKSGNIHCHIIFNSVRLRDVEKKAYMERPSETKEGMKHRCSGKFMHHIREKVMEMCRRAKLNQIDLFKGKSGVKDREYHAIKRGTNKQTNSLSPFESYKQELRDCINLAKFKTNNFEEMKQYLKDQYDIGIKESRGRVSYIHPERKDKQPIRDDKLGNDFRKENITYGNTQPIRDNTSGRITGINNEGTGDTRSQSTDTRTKTSPRGIHKSTKSADGRKHPSQSGHVGSANRYYNPVSKQQPTSSRDNQQQLKNRTR